MGDALVLLNPIKAMRHQYFETPHDENPADLSKNLQGHSVVSDPTTAAQEPTNKSGDAPSRSMQEARHPSVEEIQRPDPLTTGV